jgi:hypothetical protein
MNQSIIFEIIADGRKRGIVVAKDAASALCAAKRGLTRKTVSKEDGEADFDAIEVIPFGQQLPPGVVRLSPRRVNALAIVTLAASEMASVRRAYA